MSTMSYVIAIIYNKVVETVRELLERLVAKLRELGERLKTR